MEVSELKVGDRIRITGIPGEGVPGYYLDPETKQAYKELIARGRSVRIAYFKWDLPWYEFRLRMKNGQWEYHSMVVAEGDNNWVPVLPRRTTRKPRRKP